MRLGWWLDHNGWELGGRRASQDFLKSLRPGQQLGSGDLMDGLKYEMILCHSHAYMQSELAHLDVEFEKEVFSKVQRF